MIIKQNIVTQNQKDRTHVKKFVQKSKKEKLAEKSNSLIKIKPMQHFNHMEKPMKYMKFLPHSPKKGKVIVGGLAIAVRLQLGN